MKRMRLSDVGGRKSAAGSPLCEGAPQLLPVPVKEEEVADSYKPLGPRQGEPRQPNKACYGPFGPIRLYWCGWAPLPQA